MKKISVINFCTVFPLSIIYGCFIYLVVPIWSFDYDAIVKTVEYFRSANLSFRVILGFNGFTLNSFAGLGSILNLDNETTSRIFYSVAAVVRFNIFFLLFGRKAIFPFSAMFVAIDLNTSRYSLGYSFFTLLFYLSMRQEKAARSIRFVIEITISFFLHHLAALVYLLQIVIRSKFLYLALGAISLIAVVFFKDVFSRLFGATGDPFPGISLVYLLLCLIIIFGNLPRIEISPLILVSSIIAGLVSLKVLGFGISSNYYTRFSFALFDFLIVLHLVRYKKFDLKNLLVNTCCALSFLYQSVLIGGNIWRFF